MLVAARLTAVPGVTGLKTSADLAVLIPSQRVAELADRHDVAWSAAR
ncbi:MAG TPA: hypothetical protein VIJ39_04485 [Solirubrobacteraceae bacterium]